MDDDLMSLRGGSTPPSGGGSDDLLGDLGAPTPASAPPQEGGSGLSIEGFDAPASPPAAPAAAKKAPAAKKTAPRRAGGNFLGLTPQQRMLLSIFVFMDVSVLGCLILIALGAIKV